MSVKGRDIDTVFNKLDLTVEETHHRIAWFVHDGRRILKTRRSQGKGDIPMFVYHKIRSQLKVNENQMSGLVRCTVNKDDYVQILRDKGLLTAPPRPEDSD
jgi:hypothetical protein